MSMFSPSMFGRIGQVGQGVAGAFSDIFGAEGDIAEAGRYTTAASLAEANARFTEQMTAIREMQTQREVQGVIGKQQAIYAGGNIAPAGSALELLRSSVAQGSLQQYILAEQGRTQELAYQEQAQSYRLMASAAEHAAVGGEVAAGIRGLTAIASLASF